MKPATTTDKLVGGPECAVQPGVGSRPEPVDRSLVQHLNEPRTRPGIQAPPASGFRRVAWFVLIWLCSVSVLAIVAGLIRWVIKP